MSSSLCLPCVSKEVRCYFRLCYNYIASTDRSSNYIREDIFEDVGDSRWKTPKPPSYATPSTGSSWLPQVSEVPRRNIRAVESTGRVRYIDPSTRRDIDVTTHTTTGHVNATKEVKWNDDVTAKADAQKRVEDTYINNARRPQTPYHFESPSEKVSNPWMIENQKKYSNAVDKVNKKYMNEVRGSPSTPADWWVVENDHIDDTIRLVEEMTDTHSANDDAATVHTNANVFAASSPVDSVQASSTQLPRLTSLVRPLNTKVTNDIDDGDAHVPLLPRPPKKKKDKKKRRHHNKKKITESNEDVIQNDLELNDPKEPTRSNTFQPHPPTAPKPMTKSMKPHPPTPPKPTTRQIKPNPPTAPKPVLPNISRKTYKQTDEAFNTPISKEEEERRFKQEQDKLRFNLRVTRKIMEENNVNNGALNAEARKKWKQATFYD